MSNDLKYQLAMCLIPGVGPVTAKKLIAYCGGAKEVFKEKKQALIKIPSIGKSTANSIINNKELFKQVDQEIDFISKYKINTLYYLDSDYPARLKPLEDSPILLFTKGNCNINNKYTISIVGTRNATRYGKDITTTIIKDLADINPIVISGLAYGIDITAHKAALDNKLETGAVLGHGLDKIYPPLHRSIAEKITNSGVLITEFFSKTNPDRENFPRRNRIVAGLADAVLAVEAAEKGGALITAYYANDYNRDVFAIPGKTTNEYSKGCNHLIKTQKAHLVESAEDIKYIMNWEKHIEKKPAQQVLFKELNDEQTVIVNILKNNQPANLNFIVTKSEMTFAQVTTILLELELCSVVKSLPGYFYSLA